MLTDNAATREWSSALRELSAAARRCSATLRARNLHARERAADLSATARAVRADVGTVSMTANARPSLVAPAEGRVEVQELVDILTGHHGWTSSVHAWIAVAVEMELGGFPTWTREVEAADALDLLHRVLERHR